MKIKQVRYVFVGTLLSILIWSVVRELFNIDWQTSLLDMGAGVVFFWLMLEVDHRSSRKPVNKNHP